MEFYSWGNYASPAYIYMYSVFSDIKTGSRRYVMTTKELKLEETCALVQTLSNWKVVEKVIEIFSAQNIKKDKIHM